MTTETIVQTDAELFAEARRFWSNWGGLSGPDHSRRRPPAWSVAADGTLTLRTAAGPLTYRAGDGDELTCGAGHTYFRVFGRCKQCVEKAKHSLDPATQYAARMWLGKLPLARIKRRLEAARSGAAPGVTALDRPLERWRHMR